MGITTQQEWTVLRAIPSDRGPYTDLVHRRSGLRRPAFDAAVARLVKRCILVRFNVAHGEALYPTLRGAAYVGQGPAQ